MSSSSMDKKVLLIREVRGEGPDWSNLQEGDSNTKNQTLQQLYAEQHL